MQSTRREFIRIVPIAVAAASTGVTMSANAGAPMLDPKDPAAVGLSYILDAAKSIKKLSAADQVKYKAYKDGAQCSSCALFQGKPGDTSGGCGIFAAKQVMATSWCAAYNKKA